MSAQHQHSNARLTGRWRPLGLAAVLLLSVGLGACAALQPPSAAPTAAAVPLPYDGEVDAGTYIGSGYPVPFEITVPDGWEMKDGWLLIKGGDDPEAVFLNFLLPRYVPTDACAGSRTLAEVEPTVQAFADALAAQSSTTTTAPVDVAVGDYAGVEFDLSVDSGIDIADCASSHICIHSETSGHCTRYYQSVDRGETYRVIDLNGDRVVMTRGQDKGAPAAWLEEARAVFDSITFVSD